MRPRQRILGPDDSRAPGRRRTHGLTPAEVGALFVIQGGACALCGRLGEALQVDHDHRHCAGREGCRQCVRGLLCPRCNTALGKLGDQRIPRLIEYLSR